MEIADIINLETPMEMRREVLKSAIKKGLPEDYIWKQVEIYRANFSEGKKYRKPAHIGEILLTVLPGIGEITMTDTPIETRLEFYLRHRNIDFEIQKKIGKYQVDFFFPQADLVVEADGKDYHYTKEQREKDEKRDYYLMKRGYTVVRFTGSEIFSNVERVVAKILSFLGD